MDTLLRFDLSRIFAAGALCALAVIAWSWSPASLELGFLRLAVAPGLMLSGLGLLLGGRRGAFVAVGLWCEVVIAMLVVGLLYLLLTGPIY
jgi:hypothetical protein